MCLQHFPLKRKEKPTLNDLNLPKPTEPKPALNDLEKPTLNDQLEPDNLIYLEMA